MLDTNLNIIIWSQFDAIFDAVIWAQLDAIFDTKLDPIIGSQLDAIFDTKLNAAVLVAWFGNLFLSLCHLYLRLNKLRL